MTTFELEAELHAALSTFASLHGVTNAQVLLGVLAVYLARVTRNEGAPLEFCGQGRDPRLLRVELERSFLALLPGLRETATARDLDEGVLRLQSSDSQTLHLRVAMSDDARTLRLASSADDAGTAAVTLDLLPARLIVMLRAMLQDANTALAQLPLLPLDEQQLLAAWNGTERRYPDSCGVHQLFEAQAQRTPNAIALVAGDRRIDYAALDARANRLARALRRHGVARERLVALLVDRSIEAIVAILGVLKAGGAYVPLDPAAPLERLHFILEETQAALLLYTGKLVERLSAQAAVLAWALEDEAAQAELSGAALTRDDVEVGPRDLAYVIYTSGSTGKPKGVLVEHRSVCNHCAAWQHLLDHKPGRRVLQAAPLFFDAAVWEIFPTLASGAELHIPTGDATLPGPELTTLLRSQRIQVLGMTPSALAALPVDSAAAQLPDLEVVLSGGEACSAQLVARFAPGRQMWNGYGPTETTCDATTTQCLADGTAPAIGRPLPNLRAYVLDARRQPLPIETPGELYIGGVGVARGYLNRPLLTAEKFVADPFAPAGDGRMYATGDLARWRRDGQLEYLGRIDQQIKLRGQRIELGEIDAVLAEHPHVQQGRAAARQDKSGAVRLVAYVVPQPAQQPTVAALREHLGKHLPAYMIPSAFVFVAALPLTANGKLDVAALPTPVFQRDTLGTEFVAPRTEREQALVQIFSAVLGIDELGVRDNFFALGGDSIAALSCVARARTRGIFFSVKDLFENPTLEALAGCVTEGPARSNALAAVHSRQASDQARDEASTSADFPLCGLSEDALRELCAKLGLNTRGMLEDLYPLSPMQEGMVFHTLLSPGSAVYFEQTQHTIAGPLDADCLARAWQLLVDRQPALRTAFVLEPGGRLLQCVHARANLIFVQHDLRGMAQDACRAELERIAAQRRAEGFALERPPLLRIDLMRTGAQDFTQLICFHHALLDGWSEPKLLAEVVSTYDALRLGDEQPRPPAATLRDYHAWLAQQDLQAAEAFFRQMLSGFSAPTPLLGARGGSLRDKPVHKRAAKLTRTLAAELDAALRRTAQAGRITLSTLFQSAFALLLCRTSGEDDVVFGTTVSGRPPLLADIESRLGLFINTLPLRAVYDDEAPFIDWARRLQEAQVAAREFEYVPLVKLQACSEVPRGQPLFDSLLVFENYPREPGALRARSGWRVTDVQQHEMTNFALTVSVIPGRELTIQFEYDEHRLAPDAVERLLHCFESLLRSIADDAQRPLWRMSLSSQDPPQGLDTRWRSPRLPRVDVQQIHELFTAQARRTPEAAAILSGASGAPISYDALDRRANQLARTLREAGVGANSLVGVLLEEASARLLGMLAIWKAGGIYVPLAPDQPDERLRLIVQDLEAAQPGAAPRALLLCQASTLARLGDATLPRIHFEDAQAASAAQPADHVEPATGAEDASYVIYTSGSTGQPKGVVVTHGNAVRSTLARLQIYEQPVGRCLQLASCMFDSSLAEILWTLASGGALVVIEAEQKAPRALCALIAAQQITHLLCVPSFYAQLLDAAEDGAQLASLRTVCLGGEALPRPLIALHRARLPDAALYNEYGPTEATIWSTVYRVPETLSGEGSVPIGRPIPGTEVFVLDRHQQPVPIGAPGELYIGGDGVARGYLNRPELTTQKFVAGRVDETGGDGPRLYRTGDRVRLLPDGNLDFLGRFDEQVKLRGFRIELGEIEAALLVHPEVQGCAVLMHDAAPGEPRLVAYVVPHRAAEEAPAATSLREHLRRRLPYYMLPGAFIFLTALPRTASGKVDRRALPAPVFERGAQTYVAPRTPAEQILSEVFAELLGVTRVGIDDDFFALGGHSLLCIQVASRAAQAGLKVSVADVYMRPTVAELAAQLLPQALPSCVVPLVAGSAPGAIIFLPAVGGHLSAHILRLARGLRGERPVYGLTTPPHAGTDAMPRTLVELCARYHEDLDAATPAEALRGPLVLIGYCFGGAVALELACQLQAAGRSVEQVLLLETVAPHLDRAPREPFDRVAALLRVAERWDLHLPAEALHAQSEDQVLARIMAVAAAADSQLVRAYAERTLRAIVDTQEASRDMIEQWTPRLPDAAVHLVRVADPAAPAIPRDYGWSTVKELTSVHVVPGDHFGFIRSPYIEITLQHLRALTLSNLDEHRPAEST